MEKKDKNKKVGFAIAAFSTLLVIFGAVFFIEAFGKSDQQGDDDGEEIKKQVVRSSQVALSCSDGLTLAYSGGTEFTTPSKTHTESLDNEFLVTNTTSDGKTFASTVSGENEKHLTFKIKFSAVNETCIYLSNASHLFSYDITDRKTSLAGASRISFLDETDRLNSVVILNDTYEVTESEFLQNGEREDSYGYKISDQISYSEEDYLNHKVLVGVKNLANPRANLINEASELCSLAAGETKQLTINVWFEATDREIESEITDKVDIKLDFVGILKNDASEEVEEMMDELGINYSTWGLYCHNRIITTSDSIIYSFNGIDFMGPFNETGSVFADPEKKHVYVKKSETSSSKASSYKKIILHA